MADGSRQEGSTVDGICHGHVREFDDDGDLSFEGEYRDGVRHGVGQLLLEDGGVLHGTWQGGTLDGPGLYLYPIGAEGTVHGLRGTWREGELYRSVHVVDPAPCWEEEEAARLPPGATRYRYEPSTATAMLAPMAKDPYEASRVRVKPGGGLVALVSMEAGEVAAFFNGTRVKEPKELAREGWRPGDAVMAVPSILPPSEGEEDEEEEDEEEEEDKGGDSEEEEDEDEEPVEYIEVPPAALAAYTATLGHTARLADDYRVSPNAVWEPFWHPRFGAIGSLRTIEPIPRGEEILVAPHYATGGRISPESEAGYYDNLRRVRPQELFAAPSQAGFGRVRVTRHGPWRVLHFNQVEQIMSYRPKERRDAGGRQQRGGAPLCGFEYVRTMAEHVVRHAQAHKPNSSPVWCVGLGALPVHLAWRLARGEGLKGRRPVRCVEVDETVINAARDALKLNFRLEKEGDDNDAGSTKGGKTGGGPEVRHGDAAVVFRELAEQQPGGLCCVALDAYDGEGLVPVHLQQAPFLRDVCSCLEPGGMVICNLFNGIPGSAAGGRLEAFVGQLEKALGKGGQVTRLVVEGQEMNVVIQARKAKAAKA